MTDQYTGPYTMAGPVPARPALATADARQVRVAGLLFLALAVLGCLLGPLWSWWSPPGPLGERIPAGVIADESEAFIAADGRFALITTVVGLVTASVIWFARSVRGPWIAAALGLGGVVGAVLTDVVGHAVRGEVHAVRVAPGIYRIDHLPLQVQATGLLLLEGAAALLVYGLCVAFAARDDLGRADPVRDALRASGKPDSGQSDSRQSDSGQPGSVQSRGEPDDGGGDGDAAGAPQQGDLPAQ
jgi:hypothetical protein